MALPSYAGMLRTPPDNVFVCVQGITLSVPKSADVIGTVQHDKQGVTYQVHQRVSCRQQLNLGG